MKKSDIKAGMVVKLKCDEDNQSRVVVPAPYPCGNIKEGDLLLKSLVDGGYMPLNGYDDDLTNPNPIYDIVLVYTPYLGTWGERDRHQKWTPPVEMTLEQVCKELGRNIKIVEEK